MEINKLSIQEKIGQMIIVGMDTNYITDRIKTMITKYKIGGIILYRKNFNSYKDMLKLIQELKQLNQSNRIPLFITIDQEGGRVNRMPKDILNLPAANKVASTGGIDLVVQAAKITGEILNKSGYSLNFSPVLDIKRFNDNHAIGDRCYGENKEDVIKYAIPVMKELQKQGVIPVIKHFPGHGATKEDSHYFLPVIKDLKEEDMYPFEKAIKEGADAMLVGHFLIRKITGLYPTSLSRKFITKYIRKKYRYNGVIMTDDLKMKAIKFVYGADLAVKKAFESGSDIVIFRFNKDEEKRVIDQVIKLVEKGKIRESRINRSVKRIVRLKEKYNISDNQEIKGIDVEKINQQIAQIREKCNI